MTDSQATGDAFKQIMENFDFSDFTKEDDVFIHGMMCQFDETGTTYIDPSVDGVDYEKDIYIFKPALKLWKSGPIAYQPSQFGFLQQLQQDYKTNPNLVPPKENWDALLKDLTFLKDSMKDIKGTTVQMGSETDFPWVGFLATKGLGAGDKDAFLASVGLHPKIRARKQSSRYQDLTKPDIFKEFIEQRIMSFDAYDEGTPEREQSREKHKGFEPFLSKIQNLHSYISGESLCNPVPVFVVGDSDENIVGLFGGVVYT